MTTTIRRATLDDLDRVAPLFDAYRQFYGQTADLARARDFLRERMERHQSVVILAELDGEILGFTQLYPMYSSVQTAPIFILNDLFVVERVRRCGVGRLLLDSASVAAAAAGGARLMLETAQDNDAARALYRAAGWQEDHSQWYSLPLQDSAMSVPDVDGDRVLN